MATIEPQHGDILRADAEALVNTVNCVGVMGRGIALQFRKAYPGNYAAYRAAHKHDELQPGRMLVHATDRLLDGPKYIINFPTKRHWRSKSRLTDIDSGLIALVEQVRALSIKRIAIPPLGCGLGGLDWADVRPRIEAAFAAVEGVEVLLFEPGGAPAAETMARAAKAPNMTKGRAALLFLMDRYLRPAFDPHVTLLEVHKLMYFLQVAGEPLRLRFVQAKYGPYAENLRHVLNAIEGHFVTGFGDGADTPHKPLELAPGITTRSAAALEQHPETRERVERVTALIEGFESPLGMELLATVHWVAAGVALSTDEALRRVHAWGPRKRRFEAHHVGGALRALRERGWIGV